VPVTIVTEPGMKRDTFAASDAALAASGTVAVELAVVGTPAVIAYRANPISAAIARRMIKVKYASLVNLLLDRAATPSSCRRTAGRRSWPRPRPAPRRSGGPRGAAGGLSGGHGEARRRRPAERPRRRGRSLDDQGLGARRRLREALPVAAQLMIDEKGSLQGPKPVLAGHQRRALAAGGGEKPVISASRASIFG
jgi:Lipid A disaccharide synthetase